MTLRNKIFDTFATIEEILPNSETVADTGAYNIFSYSNPFDFYRKIEKSDRYIPVTQRGLRRAFARGISGIEFFIEMATSLRPLADEAQDIDEITRLLSQQKLTTNPNLHSVTILRNLIKDENPEIALYAAEGLNTIENSFIEKIQSIKDRIKENEKQRNKNENGTIDINNTSDIGKKDLKKNKNNRKNIKDYILYYLLGLLYLEFAKLLQGQHLIQLFYLKEAVSALKTTNELRKGNKRILTTLGDCYMLGGNNKTAIKIFTNLFSKYKKDKILLMRLAECYFNTGDYQNVITLANLAAKSAIELDEISNLIIYQWLLNT